MANKSIVTGNIKFRFTVVCYNILSQTLLHDHNFLYTDCNPRDLEWPRRGHRIISELLANRADIICLQEVENQHLKSLYRPSLSSFGYDCLYKKKTGYKIDGCAIFYKRNLFHLLNYKGVEFNRCDITSLLNRDNIGIIAVLRPKFGPDAVNQQLVVANTHLLFNPKQNELKLTQLKLFLTELDQISTDTTKGQHEHHPTILCGDMNSVPESDVVNYVMSANNQAPEGSEADKTTNQQNGNLNHEELSAATTNIGSNTTSDVNNASDKTATTDDDDDSVGGNLKYRLLQHFCHKFKFKSVYSSHNRQGQALVSTLSSCIVDYIFYTPRLHLESYRELLTEDQLHDVEPIPNAEFPSDHFTLVAKFSLR